jgi:hypothetical protein
MGSVLGFFLTGDASLAFHDKIPPPRYSLKEQNNSKRRALLELDMAGQTKTYLDLAKECDG